MTAEDQEEVIRFAQRSGLAIVGVMGGEPTLHPEFVPFLERFRAAGLKVRVFTGGLMPRGVLGYLKTQDPEHVRLVINVPAPDEGLTPRQGEQFYETLQELAGLSALAFTICDLRQDLRFLADLAVRFGVRRRIRLGLGVPRVAARKTVTLAPAQYRAVAPRVLEFAVECRQRGLSLGFDCGFPRCMFSEEDLAVLQGCDVPPVFTCTPVVDIGPDLTTWSCFPLASLDRVPLQDFSTREEVVEHFGTRQKPYRSFGIYDRCHVCEHKRCGACSGGCLAHVIRSFT